MQLSNVKWHHKLDAEFQVKEGEAFVPLFKYKVNFIVSDKQMPMNDLTEKEKNNEEKKKDTQSERETEYRHM